MRFFSVWVVFVAMCWDAKAQTVSIHHPQLQFLFEDTLLKSPLFHSALKPIEIKWTTYQKMMSPDVTVLSAVPQKYFHFLPVFDATVGYTKVSNSGFNRFGQGIYATGQFGRKTGFELSAVLREETFTGNRTFIDSLQWVAGYNRPLWTNGRQAGYGWICGFMWWKPLQWLTLKVGNDKHFIGDGYRSLLLSENVAAYPFFETRINIWKINYIHRVMAMSDLIPGRGSERFNKYITQHTISINVSPKLNFYVFETVIWRQTDSAKHFRGMDIAYLNPVIFYRPMEYNMGSPDNVIMGFGGKWRIFNSTYLYGQLLLDEFRLVELKANNGWWGNKYGYQAGFKTFGLFKRHTSMLQLEYNQCRPFTYSHSFTQQNYGNLFMPMAHPQGSNFRELSGIFRMKCKKQWFVHLTGSFMVYGTDPEGENYGSDIYKQQWTFTKYNGNYIGQGINTKQLSGNIVISRMLVPTWRLQAFGEVNGLLQKTESASTFMPGLRIGVNTLLYE